MTPRILFDGRGITAKPCGVRNVAENYLMQFSKRYKITVIVNAGMEHVVPEGVNIVVANKFKSRFNPIADFWISWLVLTYKPDVFFSAHSFLPVLAHLPTKRVFVCHDLFSVFDKSFFNKRGRIAPIIRLYFRIITELSFVRSEIIIAPSDAIRDTFRRLLFFKNNVITIPNGIDEFNLENNIYVRLKQILYVGNFRSYKGIDVLLTAWRQIFKLDISREWRLTIVSNEAASAVMQLRKNNEDLERIDFHSRISNEQLLNLRKKASIIIVPSRDEGFGIPLLEAIASGGKVISSDITVFREILSNFDSDVCDTFQSEDSCDLANKICINMKMIESSDLSRIDPVAVNSQLVLRSIYSWSAAASKFDLAVIERGK